MEDEFPQGGFTAGAVIIMAIFCLVALVAHGLVNLGQSRLHQGPLGPDGSQGPPGSKGDPGPVGIAGPIGVHGPQGLDGSLANAGPTGHSGRRGDPALVSIGQAGSSGLSGDQGSIGYTGPDGSGSFGDTGHTGASAIDAFTLPPGSTGGTLISQDAMLPPSLTWFSRPAVQTTTTLSTITSMGQVEVNGMTLNIMPRASNSPILIMATASSSLIPTPGIEDTPDPQQYWTIKSTATGGSVRDLGASLGLGTHLFQPAEYNIEDEVPFNVILIDPTPGTGPVNYTLWAAATAFSGGSVNPHNATCTLTLVDLS